MKKISFLALLSIFAPLALAGAGCSGASSDTAMMTGSLRNWVEKDGKVETLNEPSLIVSGGSYTTTYIVKFRSSAPGYLGSEVEWSAEAHLGYCRLVVTYSEYRWSYGENGYTGRTFEDSVTYEHCGYISWHIKTMAS